MATATFNFNSSFNISLLHKKKMKNKALKLLIALFVIGGVYVVSSKDTFAADIQISPIISSSGTDITFSDCASTISDNKLNLSAYDYPNNPGGQGYITHGSTCSSFSATNLPNTGFQYNQASNSTSSPTQTQMWWAYFQGSDSNRYYFTWRVVANQVVEINGSPIFGTGNGTTGFIPPYDPISGSIIASTTIYFTVPFYFNDLQSYGIYDAVAIEINDSLGSSTERFAQRGITSSGNATITASRLLTYGHFYLWRPVMYSTTGSTSPIYGSYYSLQVGTSSQPFTPFDNPETNGVNFLAFVNVPQLLNTKFPFAYISQIADVVYSAIGTSTGNTLPNGSISFPNVGNGTTTIDMFSTSTIEKYLPTNTINIFRGLLAAAIYIGTFLFLFKRVQSVI